MMDFLFDTNTVSALLKQNKVIAEKVNDVTDKGAKIFLSIVTDYEIRRGLFAVNATTQLKNYEILRQQYQLLWIDNLEISKQAAKIHADLKQKGQIIQEADILIAATALVNNLTVVTSDNHFLRIPDLKVENWFSK
jgi:tRNA(fMet)-specific endonuclease VapC